MLNINKLKKRHRPFFAFIIGTSVVLFWRGMWGLLDIYFIPEKPVVSYALSMVIGLTMLYITHYWIKELE
ncbi:MAG: hypothetical protein JW922_08835 [Paludibacteraceae bacterium]|nr:hypothetical protein [Paludibacteraceae bacterium]